jgi:DNA topoisomerase-1
MPRVHRVSLEEAGFSRRRRGKGFEYRDRSGARIDDPDVVVRIRSLAIPPAWSDVWICPDPWGHLQASGIDAAGRRQYLYHERWRTWRDRLKFRRMRAFAAVLPSLRESVEDHLAADGLGRDRVLALAVRLLDLGLFRIGSKEYADQNGSYGLSTLRKEHAEADGHGVTFDFPAKGGIRRAVSIRDEQVEEVLRALKRPRDGDRLLVYRDGRSWRELRAGDINAYIRELAGNGFTAKDFRTWHATVLAALALAARAEASPALSARKRAAADAVKEVAETLGNTPAVCRSSYIDPAVLDAYLEGRTIAPRLAEIDREELERPAVRLEVERSVLELLTGEGSAEADADAA